MEHQRRPAVSSCQDTGQVLNKVVQPPTAPMSHWISLTTMAAIIYLILCTGVSYWAHNADAIGNTPPRMYNLVGMVSCLKFGLLPHPLLGGLITTYDLAFRAEVDSWLDEVDSVLVTYQPQFSSLSQFCQVKSDSACAVRFDRLTVANYCSSNASYIATQS